MAALSWCVVTSLLLSLAGTVGGRAPAATGTHAATTGAQTLAVVGSEQNGIVMRRFRLGSDGSLASLSRIRLPQPGSDGRIRRTCAGGRERRFVGDRADRHVRLGDPTDRQHAKRQK